MSSDYSSIRHEFVKGTLSEDTLINDPLDQFRTWLDEYQKVSPSDLTAMTLATVDKQMLPRQRVLLLKGLDNGFVFFTNKDSVKGQQIADNSLASMHFFWPELERQIHIQGRIEDVANQASDEYFHSRPVESQIGAHVSKQSEPLASREVMEEDFFTLQAEYENEEQPEIPRPAHWGGYRLVPERVEFWQGGRYRLHDRFEYVLENGVWKIQRLYP